MNTKKTWLGLGALLILLTSTFTPVSAGNISALTAQSVTVTIDNQAEIYRYVVFTGPATITQMVYPGKVTLQMEVGYYDYSYWGCGVQVTGSLRVKKSGAKLIIPSCSSPATSSSSSSSSNNSGGGASAPGGTYSETTGKLTFKNSTWEDVRMTLIGQTAQWITINRGKTHVELPAGMYSYSYQLCGLWQTGTYEVKANKTRTFELECENEKSVKSKIGRVLIINNTKETIRFIIRGPIYKEITIEPGREWLFLPWDDYDYYTYYNGTMFAGTFEASKDKTTLRFELDKIVFTTG